MPVYKESSDLDKEDIHESDDELLDDEQWDKSYVEESIPEQFSQNELNDLVCDLDLSKESSELLASRLAEKS